MHKLVSVPLFLGLVLAQAATSGQKLQGNGGESQASKVAKAESPEIQRRSFAIALIKSLASEAQSYEDESLRARILARAADTLWQADDQAARSLFRRAWETAEKADANKQRSSSNLPPIALSLERSSGRDLRAEVLSLAARRDRTLGEEFLGKLAEDDKREASETQRDSSAGNSSDSWTNSDASIKRLLLARRLLDNGQIERALEFAEPALNKVNTNTIGFLAALRVRRPDTADQRFANLLSLSELDPSSDANTVSGLSSYVFTPNLYVTFSADGSVRWSQLEQTETSLNPPVLPTALLKRFFRTAASILLRPLPPPEHDFSSSGRTGKAMVLKRLLPLFDQYVPETAAVLRSRLTALLAAPLKSTIDDDHSLLTQDLPRTRTADDLLTEMQERLDRAKTTEARDSIYSDTATGLANQDDARAQDLIDKVDKPTLRTEAGRYVVMQLIHLAIKQKDQAEVVRLTKAEHLTHIQRAWAYTQAARLSLEPDRQYSLRMLEEAANEARRIDASDPDRARALVSVATQFATADRVRAWEIMAEAVKAANSAANFSGADMTLRYGVVTSSGLKLGSVGGADFGLSGVFGLLAKEDLYRSLDLAKSFKSEAPRATATLAIVNQLLE